MTITLQYSKIFYVLSWYFCFAYFRTFPAEICWFGSSLHISIFSPIFKMLFNWNSERAFDAKWVPVKNGKNGKLWFTRPKTLNGRYEIELKAATEKEIYVLHLSFLNNTFESERKMGTLESMDYFMSNFCPVSDRL